MSPKREEKVCRTPGCDGAHYAQGLCERCYRREYRRRHSGASDRMSDKRVSYERSMIEARIADMKKGRLHFYGSIKIAVLIQRKIEDLQRELAELDGESTQSGRTDDRKPG